MIKAIKSFNESVRGHKYLMQLFILFALISCLYSIISGKFNGDFLGSEVFLGEFLLTFNLMFTVAPLFVLWAIFKRFKYKEFCVKTLLFPKYFLVLAYFLIIWNIAITFLFGVGVVGSSVYSAPDFIKPLIQISLRLNPFFIAFVLILSSKSNAKNLILISLLVLLSLMRSSIGVVLFLMSLFFIKYSDYILRFIRRNVIVFLVICFVLVIVAQALFSFRAELRGFEVEEMSLIEFGVGRLIGRLSSFSNSAMIIQGAPFFVKAAEEYSDYFPLMQSLGGVVSGSLLPEMRPEISLFLLNNPGDESGNSSFMAGVNGVLYFAFFKSWLALLISIFLYFSFIYWTLWLAYSTKRKYLLDVTYLFLLYLCVSGVFNEFGYLLVSVLAIYLLIKFNDMLASCKRPKHK